MVGFLFAAIGTASAQSNVLWTNQSLRPGQYLLSQYGRFQFIFQLDGNVVLYDLWDRHRALWASNTVNRRGFVDTHADNLVMQGDGNLVLYGHYIYPASDIWANPRYRNRQFAFWASGSSSYGQPHADPSLLVQDDGNVVIYMLPLITRDYPIWATNTW